MHGGLVFLGWLQSTSSACCSSTHQRIVASRNAATGWDAVDDWTCHAVPATEGESEIAAQFFSAPYPCQNGQPLNGDGDSSGNGEGDYVDGGGCCCYLDEPYVSLGVNTLPCTSIDPNLLVGN
ncbi:hypothetical protein GUJ93_ZPchr0013g34026 [Zizania palustris]|uniref:Secreted protein n=1 Tax=Zizania palustris TaxID=103762 RepID=A0A8J5WYM6_ZIZPA|nr:hypothetical protein GUJ93_ZPchr0013g34026 [Zizania palustris]